MKILERLWIKRNIQKPTHGKKAVGSLTTFCLNEVEEKQQENKVRKDSIDTFIDRLKSQETNLTCFDEALWYLP